MNLPKAFVSKSERWDGSAGSGVHVMFGFCASQGAQLPIIIKWIKSRFLNWLESPAKKSVLSGTTSEPSITKMTRSKFGTESFLSSGIRRSCLNSGVTGATLSCDWVICALTLSLSCAAASPGGGFHYTANLVVTAVR